MARVYRSLLVLVGLVLGHSFGSASVWAATVTITTDTTIGTQSAGDGYVNNDIVIDGATVTVTGAHDWASLQLVNGAVLTHPAEVTEKLELNIAGGVEVDSTSAIDVSALGVDQVSGGHPSRSGAAHGGHGGVYPGYGVTEGYGSVTEPVTYGGGRSSSHGGGAIKLAAASLTLDGAIRADAGSPLSASYGGNSGGSIWLDVGTLSGSGTISANGNVGNAAYGGGAGGRVAVYYTNAIDFALEDQITAYGVTRTLTVARAPSI